ncbi:hypothetical protein HNP24_000822 [Chryseobacterium sediminis]|uniref:Uncharacterized protein n=1 Tax=Chryseobacterium sediminis TaxID=1679494 RepID=A0ABR6PVY2_9FLAO|nr:hypothetical protein [Chryseobacterium sediminis]
MMRVTRFESLRVREFEGGKDFEKKYGYDEF